MKNKYFLMNGLTSVAFLCGIMAGCGGGSGGSSAGSSSASSGSSSIDEPQKEEEIVFFDSLKDVSHFTLTEGGSPAEEALSIEFQDGGGINKILFNDTEYNKMLLSPSEAYLGDDWTITPVVMDDNKLMNIAIEHDKSAKINATVYGNKDNPEYWKFSNFTKDEFEFTCDLNQDEKLTQNEKCVFTREAQTLFEFKAVEGVVDYNNADYVKTQHLIPVNCGDFFNGMSKMLPANASKCGSIGLILVKNLGNVGSHNWETIKFLHRTQTLKVQRKE